MTGRAFAAAAAFLIVAALPPAASAKAGGIRFAVRFAFASKSGYRVRVSASRSTIELRAARRAKSGDWGTATAYLSRAELSGRRVRAAFGDLGRLSMRFVPAHGPPSTGCERGRRLRVRHGLFVGLLGFSGEADYLDVRVRRVKGALLSAAGGRCEKASRPPRRRSRKPRQKDTFLEAGYRAGLDAVYFQALEPGAGRPLYSVVDEAGGGTVAVYRSAFAKGSPRSFATDDRLGFARVSPPFPFSGTGLVRRGPDGRRTWSGSLAVSFPGEPRLALTGPRFRTQLIRQW